jgi:hypothetical protein
MKLDMNNTVEVCVYPDGVQYDEPQRCRSDDYEKRKTAHCEDCGTNLDVHYGEPFASCECGTTEWYN